MTRSKKNINTIISNQLLGIISEEDKKILQEWTKKSEENQKKYNHLLNQNDLTKKYNQYAKVDEKYAWEIFQNRYLKNHQTYNWSILIVRYAAFLILPLIGLYLWLSNEEANDKGTNIPYEARVAMIRSERMGKQKATLILANGQKVKLQSPLVRSLQDAHLTNSSLKVSPTKISKEDSEKRETDINNNNQVYTYKDSEFWVTFEDGTKVHLNYNTTLKYPTHFSPYYRIVYLDGEAYFQVAKDRSRPFLVVTCSGIVKQYGTSFNVSTHEDLGTKVVLVEGSVSVIPKGEKENEYKIKPGELAVMQNNQNSVQISKVDIEPYVAWNKGRFVFEDCSLEKLMLVISGWYNRNITFESEDIKRMRFTGDIDRYESIVPVINAIERVTGLNVEVTEKNIIIKNVILTIRLM